MVAASRGADALGPAVPRPDRRRPRRRHRRRVRAQPHDRRDGRKRARPRRRRHRRRRDDGGIGGQGAAREADARGRHVRPPRLPAGDPGHHQAGGEGGQGAVGLPAARQVQVRRQGQGAGRRPILRKAFATPEKQKRHELVEAASAKVKKELLPADADAGEQVLLGSVFKGLEQDVVRGDIIRSGKRIDGRDLKTVRPIRSEVHVLPRTHGSALFTRGETQALVVATLGTGEDEQYIDALEGTRKERFLLHYNFPPYSVGETGRMGSPGRREIGHGKLAWRAVHPLMPTPGGVPLHGARRLRDHRIQRLLVDGDRVRRLAGADGCRRAAEAPGRRHRHGPDQGGQQLRRALRHPGRRGPPGRHGLQGGRHREGRHLAADGHQDRRHHRGDHAPGAGAGERRPPAHPRRDGARPSPAPAPSSASTRRASRPSRSRSTRSAR